VFDYTSSKWSNVETTGERSPSPRYGHGFEASDGIVFMFGGRSVISCGCDGAAFMHCVASVFPGAPFNAAEPSCSDFNSKSPELVACSVNNYCGDDGWWLMFGMFQLLFPSLWSCPLEEWALNLTTWSTGAQHHSFGTEHFYPGYSLELAGQCAQPFSEILQGSSSFTSSGVITCDDITPVKSGVQNCSLAHGFGTLAWQLFLMQYGEHLLKCPGEGPFTGWSIVRTPILSWSSLCPSPVSPASR
jgi:hypothetical protein